MTIFNFASGNEGKTLERIDPRWSDANSADLHVVNGRLEPVVQNQAPNWVRHVTPFNRDLQTVQIQFGPVANNGSAFSLGLNQTTDTDGTPGYRWTSFGNVTYIELYKSGVYQTGITNAFNWQVGNHTLLATMRSDGTHEVWYANALVPDARVYGRLMGSYLDSTPLTGGSPAFQQQTVTAVTDVPIISVRTFEDEIMPIRPVPVVIHAPEAAAEPVPGEGLLQSSWRGIMRGTARGAH